MRFDIIKKIARGGSLLTLFSYLWFVFSASNTSPKLVVRSSSFLILWIFLTKQGYKTLCDQNNSYEVSINGFQFIKINEIRNVIFDLRYGKPSSALRPTLGCSPSWVLDEIRIFGGKPCLSNKDSTWWTSQLRP